MNTTLFWWFLEYISFEIINYFLESPFYSCKTQEGGFFDLRKANREDIAITLNNLQSNSFPPIGNETYRKHSGNENFIFILFHIRQFDKF